MSKKMKGTSLKPWMRQRLWLLWEPDSDDNSHGVVESADMTSNWWSVGAAVAKSILWVDGIFGYLGLKHVDMSDGGGSLKNWPQLMNYVVTVIDGTPVTVIDDTPLIGVCRGVTGLIQCRWSVCRWSYTFDSVPLDTARCRTYDTQRYNHWRPPHLFIGGDDRLRLKSILLCLMG